MLGQHFAEEMKRFFISSPSGILKSKITVALTDAIGATVVVAFPLAIDSVDSTGVGATISTMAIVRFTLRA